LAVFGSILVVMLSIQFALKRYFAPVYWACIVLISIAGTLITDIMVDLGGIQHYVTEPLFGVLLMITFGLWYYVERTLSIHSIYTARREFFYWMAVFWTFAFGTSTGDMIGEDGPNPFGYWRTMVLIAGVILFDFIVYILLEKLLKPPRAWIAILTFWIAYILTRPLGAAIGDFLTADRYPSYSGDIADCSKSNYILGSTTTIDDFQSSVCDATGDTACITNCDQYGNCTVDADSTCPFADGRNVCPDLYLTCYTPLACDRCWGLEGIVQTNIAFSCAVVVAVIAITITGYDQIVKKKKESDPERVDPSSPNVNTNDEKKIEESIHKE
jgi:uncharacterized membrane-anchored protein